MIVCIGESIGLDVDECAAWVELYDALDGNSWVGHNNASAAAARTNPCAALSDWWKKTIVCSKFRDFSHITEIYLMGLDIHGVLPASFGAFKQVSGCCWRCCWGFSWCCLWCSWCCSCSRSDPCAAGLFG